MHISENQERQLSPIIVLKPSAPTWPSKVLMLLVVGFIGSIITYNLYERRGARFPVRYGRRLLINHRMGACTVRSLQVTTGLFHMAPGHSHIARSFSITLDIENTHFITNHRPYVEPAL